MGIAINNKLIAMNFQGTNDDGQMRKIRKDTH